MRVAIVIVSMASVGHLAGCLPCLAAGNHQDFTVVIPENAGAAAAGEAQRLLLERGIIAPRDAPDRFVLLPGGQAVSLFATAANLGYAGGVNAGILAAGEEWDAVWVLNPDTFPAPDALAALIRRQAEGGYGMVGSRLLFAADGRVQCWGGIAWRRWLYRGRLLGFRQPPDMMPDIAAVERAMAFVSGASMFVIRDYVRRVGLMDDSFFAFDEDADWCMRRGDFRLGYAHDSVVRHVHGASTGSSSLNKRGRSRFNLFLMERNALLLARKHAGPRYPLVMALRFLQTFEELVRNRSPRHFLWAQQGFWAGLGGKTGAPPWLAPSGGSGGA